MFRFNKRLLLNLLIISIFIGCIIFLVFLIFNEENQIFENVCNSRKKFDQMLILIPIILTIFLYLNKKSSFNENPINPFCKQNRFITSLIFLDIFYKILNIFNLSIIQIKLDFKNSSEIINYIQGNLNLKILKDQLLIGFFFKILDLFIISVDYYPILVCIGFKSIFFPFNLGCFVYLVFKFIHRFLKEIICKPEANFDIDIWAHQFILFLICIIFMLKILPLKNKKKEPSNEIMYTKIVFKKYKNVSFLNKFYQYKKFYRYSNQFVLTNGLTIFIISYTTYKLSANSYKIVNSCAKLAKSIALNGILLVNETLSGKKIISNSHYNIFGFIENLSEIFQQIMTSTIITTYLLSLSQLFLGMLAYKNHVLEAYQGKYEAIPNPNQLDNSKIISASVNFSGFKIAYCLWGYTNLLFFTLIIIIIIRLFLGFNTLFALMAKILVPWIGFFFFKKYTIQTIASLVLTDSRKKLSLKNRKLYFLINYFTFFLNCFLTWFVCFMRFFGSFFVGIFFAFRLDHSVYCRKFEKRDPGFMSYASFIHMEICMSHPIKLAFCELVTTISAKKKTSRLRNKWFLIYTLINNPVLVMYRKKINKRNLKKIDNLSVILAK